MGGVVKGVDVGAAGGIWLPKVSLGLSLKVSYWVFVAVLDRGTG